MTKVSNHSGTFEVHSKKHIDWYSNNQENKPRSQLLLEQSLAKQLKGNPRCQTINKFRLQTDQICINAKCIKITITKNEKNVKTHHFSGFFLFSQNEVARMAPNFACDKGTSMPIFVESNNPIQTHNFL